MNEFQDFPLVTKLRESRPVAAKDHTCTICGHTIHKGTRYIRFVYTDDEALDRTHKLRTSRIHEVCDV